MSGKATPRYLSWEGQGPHRPHWGGSSMEECVDISPSPGNAGNLDMSLEWMPGREGEQARPGDGCGQCCGWSQGREPVLHTAPTSLGCTSYPLPAPVVDLGPGWGKSWNSKPLSRPFPGVPSVCSLKHELQYVLQRPPLYFKPRASPQGYPKTSGMESRGPKSQTAHGLEPRSYPAALTSRYRCQVQI